MAEDKEKVPAEDTSNSEPQGEDKATADEPKDGVLTQKDIDKVVQGRLDREREKLEKQFSETLAEERDKWEKQSKMSQAEREQELLKEREADNRERDEKLTLRENKLDAIEQLEAEGIPKASEASEFLIGLDKDEQSTHVTSFIELVKELANEIADKQLRGETPKAISPNRGETPTREVPQTL